MHIAAGRLTLHLPESHSLKSRRQAARSLSARLRNKFNLAVAEEGSDEDRWQRLTLLVCAVSGDAAHARAMAEAAADFVAETRPDLELLDWTVEVISGV